MPTIRELQQERDTLATQARGILDTADEDGRGLTSEEEAEFDRIMEQADSLEGRIAREQRARDLERDLDREPDEPAPGTDPADRGGGGDQPSDEQRAFARYLQHGRAGLPEELARALQMSSDPDGGYLVAPQQFVADLIEEVDDMVHLRALATVSQLTEGESLGRPSRTADMDDAEWTSELSTGSEDDALKFGKRELRPHPLAKRVKVSRTLLRRASIGPEAIVRARLAYKFGVTQEKAFMTGDGNQKPLGVFVASTDGIPASRDVNTGASGAFTAEGLIDAKYTLKAAYHRRARWMFHRFAVRDIRKLRTEEGGAGTGEFLWRPGLSGEPDQILEIPYLLSEFVPNTITDGNYVGILGDFSHYWIAESLQIEVQRLVELYAESNQVGFIGRAEVDAMPTLAEAFVRLKVGA